MKIVHIQTGMTPAGNAAFRLHAAMRKVGIDSSILTYLPSVKRNNVYSVSSNLLWLPWKILDKFNVQRIHSYIKPNMYSYNVLSIYSKCHILKYIEEFDVVYVHWICGFLSLKNIRELAETGKPIIFFMHDMWTFTGGCHHSLGCLQYQAGCKNCMMFDSHKSIAAEQNKKKKKLFGEFNNLYFVAPSEWMYKCAKSSYILKDKPIFVISNIVDETIFKPIEKNIARNILNIPDNKIIITFGCQAGTKNQYKGWEYLRKAINKLSLPNIQIVVYGSDYCKQTVEEIKYPIIFLGPILDEHILSLICNATDIFVSPSLAESFGLTFLENILCGTPVVGFDSTAVPEIVKTGITGYLACFKDAEDLTNGILSLINNHISVNGRDIYSSTNIVDKHLNLINTAFHEK